MKTIRTVEVNRTGLEQAGVLAKQMLEVQRLTRPTSPGVGSDALSIRAAYAKVAEPFATLPGTAAPQPLGERETTLVDKLGERMAFERVSARLGEALLLKLDAFGAWRGGPSRADLEQIHADEREHFILLIEAVKEAGGDPTAVTPSANVSAMVLKSIVEVLTDPRTNLYECLEAIAVAKLVDNDSWMHLVNLAGGRFDAGLVARFRRALDDEREHLVKLRRWLAAGLGAQPPFRSVQLAPARPDHRLSMRATTRKTKQRAAAAKMGRKTRLGRAKRR